MAEGLENRLAALEDENEHLRTLLEQKNQKIRELQYAYERQCKDEECRRMELLSALHGLENTGELMVDRKGFRLLHIWNRFYTQFLKGSRTGRRAFLNWLRGSAEQTHRFNPLYELVDPLHAVADQLSAVPAAVEIRDQLLLSEQTKRCLESSYEKPDILLLGGMEAVPALLAENGHRVFVISPDFDKPEAVEEVLPGLYLVSFMTRAIPSVGCAKNWKGFDSWMQGQLDSLVKDYAIRDGVLLQNGSDWAALMTHLQETFGFRLGPNPLAAFASYEDLSESLCQAFPKVSVIVLTYNNLKLNRFCIDNVLHQTGYPNYELVVLDNQSTDGTVDYLRELEKENLPHLRIVFNEENSGFAGGNNKAIETCTDSKYVVLLNNDTVVTRGWLSAMVKHMEADPGCGMIGAVTNSIGNEAQIKVNYRNLREMRRFAYVYTRLHNNEKYLSVDRIALFGTIIRKELMDQYGMLDTRYKVGMFEDDDFAMTVSKAGYRFYVIEDCFIHHVNNATFRKLHPEEYRKIFDANKARYEEKWNTTWKVPMYRKGIVFEQNKDFMTEPVE